MIRRGFGFGIFGNQTFNPSADLDEDTLSAIAESTGGQYFRAHSSEELEKIYAVLDTLEPVEQEEETFRPVQTLFFWPLGLAVIITMLYAAVVIGRPLLKSLGNPAQSSTVNESLR